MEHIEKRTYKRYGRSSNKKSVRVDLTPMVDLGFLLITFFILTTSLSQPKVANLALPKDIGNKEHVQASVTLTVILQQNDSVGYYFGIPGESPKVFYTTFARFRSVIQHKQKDVGVKLGDRKQTILIIKPSDKSSYKNLIDMLDEVMINDVTHYYVSEVDQIDNALLHKK